jgi:hypothetical protein
VKTIRTLAGATALILLLAPVAKAEESALSHRSFSSIMVGADFRDESDHAAIGECMFVGGAMMNRHVGFQLEFDVTNYSGNSDAEFGDLYAIAAALKLGLPIAFVEPYVLGGAGVGLGGAWLDHGSPGGSEHTSFGFPLHAAAGIDFHFGKVLVGVEARQVWLTYDHVNFDSLLVMTKFGFRY